MMQAENETEQFVYDLCRKSFLSLWSYVNPQGRRPGKELCDILVVFDPYIIVISVKGRDLDNADDEVDGKRWLRKAIDKSIEQVSGGVRFLKTAQVVVTKDGTEGLPLPRPEDRIYHRIAVPFGGRREVPYASLSKEDDPFVHVIDDQALRVLLENLDTISDFTEYLSKKERLLDQVAVIIEGGEENLLALYLRHGRTFPEGQTRIFLQDDLWQGLSASPEYRNERGKDADSYVWDKLIESLSLDEFNSESWRGPSLAEAEQAFRVLARENRASRRELGSAFKDFLLQREAGAIRSRCIVSMNGVGYVFLAYDVDSSPDERQNELLGRSLAAISRLAGVFTIIGVGVNAPGQGPKGGCTGDLVMLDAPHSKWPAEYLERSDILREELGYFKDPVRSSALESTPPERNDL